MPYGKIFALAVYERARHLCVQYANSFVLSHEWSSHSVLGQKRKESRKDSLFFFGRSVEIRTPGLQYPKLARYQLRYTSKYSVFLLSVSLRCLSARPVGLPLHRRIVARYRLDTLGSARSLLWAVSLRKNNNQLFLTRYYQLRYTSNCLNIIPQG